MVRLFPLVFLLALTGTTLSAAGDRGLATGSKAPDFTVKDINGEEFSTRAALQKGPLVVVFYRGGWCPYCNLQLRSLQTRVLPEISRLQATMVAISVDRVREGRATRDKEAPGLRIISDRKADLLRLYRLAYKVPDHLVRRYKEEFNIDLEASSGETHHIIAVPAVLVIGTDGRIAWQYVNPDYKVRARNEDIIAAVKKLREPLKKSRKDG